MGFEEAIALNTVWLRLNLISLFGLLGCAILSVPPAWTHSKRLVDNWAIARLISLVPLFVLLGACATGKAVEPGVRHIGGGRLHIRPARVAVLMPSTGDPMLVNAYARLDAQTHLLFQQGLGSHIVERSELPAVRKEQHWQYAEPAAEEATARLGQLLGADTLILYQIKIPELRERLFAEWGTPLSPITLSAKVVRVETGEAVWSHVVTVEERQTVLSPGGGIGFNPAVWQALDRGVDEMLVAVGEAVTCEQVRCEARNVAHAEAASR